MTMFKYNANDKCTCGETVAIPYQKELEKIKKIISENPRGTTMKEIADHIGINRNVVGKYLDVLQTAGEIDVEVFGRSKVYFPSKAVPISTMIDYASELIAVFSDTMTIREINAPFIAYTGVKGKDKIIGKPMTGLPFIQQHPAIAEQIQKTMHTQEISEDEIDHRRTPNSKPDRFRIKYVPIIFKDGEKGVTIILSKYYRK